MQADTIVPEPGDPQNLNRYSYTRNNPIRYTDPTGSCIPEECPGVPDVPHPGEATGLRGEEYAAYLINYILWVDRERAATGGMVPYTYQSNQIGAATALNSFLMDDPEYLGEVFYQQLLMATPQLATMAAGASGSVMVSGGGRVLRTVRKLGVKSGSQGGPTAGKSFSNEIKQQAIQENPGRVCVFCRRPGTALQVDHAIPKALGGNATIENAQLACPHCNQSKGGHRLFPLNPPPEYSGNWPPNWYYGSWPPTWYP